MNNAKTAFQNMASRMPSGGSAPPIMPLLALGGLGVTAYNSVYQVKGGEQAIVWNRFTGISPMPKGIGMHFKIPFIDYPEILDVRTRPNTIQTLTGSKDLQMVSITLRVLTRPDTHKLPQIYRELGRDYDERVLPVTRHRGHNSPFLTITFASSNDWVNDCGKSHLTQLTVACFLCLLLGWSVW
mmetsp:Transcript_64159/g.144721  ORF Transcript_64159/g.144721 Transcript_64159/m.144721 type:complete len:184 (+) Transcript_64159:67-618(+)